MLVFSRKANEEIIIGGAVRVRVLEVRRARVRFGISAPQEIEIRRAELTSTNVPVASKPREDKTANAVAREIQRKGVTDDR